MYIYVFAKEQVGLTISSAQRPMDLLVMHRFASMRAFPLALKILGFTRYFI